MDSKRLFRATEREDCHSNRSQHGLVELIFFYVQEVTLLRDPPGLYDLSSDYFYDAFNGLFLLFKIKFSSVKIESACSLLCAFDS